jgi:hypothetical protein
MGVQNNELVGGRFKLSVNKRTKGKVVSTNESKLSEYLLKIIK